MAIDLSDVLPTEPAAISFDKSISRGGRYDHCHRHRNFRKLDAYHFRQFDRQCFCADARFQPIGFIKQFEGRARAQRDEYDHREPADTVGRGESADRLKSNPKLEAARARGIEVLLLSDPVDSFWVMSASSFVVPRMLAPNLGVREFRKIPVLLFQLLGKLDDQFC